MTISRSVVAVALGLWLGGCSSQSGAPMTPAGAAGNGGNAGSAGNAGSPGTGGSSGAAGTGQAGGPAGSSGTSGSGVAGTTGAAGTSGTVGTGDAGQDAGAGTTGSGGDTAGEIAKPSAGCGKAPAIAKGQFVMSNALGRPTWVRLPPGYDPSRPYPVIFVWKGCDASGLSTFGIENIAGNDAIIAQGDFPPGATCYDTADGAKFVDLPMFDGLLSQIETSYCADQNHVFSVGFSSGAWLTFFLACQRGDVLRGFGTIAGGFKPTFFLGAKACKGTGNTALMISDLDDHTNPFFDEDHDGDSVEIGLDQWLVTNGCSETAWTMQNGTPSDPDATLCRSYAGCGRNPVRLCLTHGIGHDPQTKLSMPGFWQLFKLTLPK